MTDKEDKEDKTVRQFVLFCRTALMYEKKNYYNERKHRAERETHNNHLATMEIWKKADMEKAQPKKNGYSYNGSFKEGESL